jgi:hypothetical protein
MVNESTFVTISRDKSLKNLSVKNIEIDNSYVTCNVINAVSSTVLGTVNLKITKVGDAVIVKILNDVIANLDAVTFNISIVNTGSTTIGPLLQYITSGQPDQSISIVTSNNIRMPGLASVNTNGKINFSILLTTPLPTAFNIANSGFTQQTLTFSL